MQSMAQSSVVCRFQLKDKDQHQSIENAAIRVNSLGIQELSDSKGNAFLSLPKKKLSLRISHLAYKDSTIYLDLKTVAEDSIQITIYLEYNPVNLDAAVIGAQEELPDTVYGSKEYNVADFAFLDESLLLLTYTKEDRWKRQEESQLTLYHGNKLILLDNEGLELDTIHIEAAAIQLYTDYLNEVFLITKTEVYAVTKDSNKLKIQTITESDFSNYIRPVFDSLNQHLLFSSWRADFPSFDYYSFSTLDSSIQHLRRVEDELQMQLLRSEYKYLDTRSKLDAYRLELKTGIDKELIAAQMSGFSNSLYAETLYAPCFVLYDSIFVFDHYHAELYKYNENRISSDSVNIAYMEDSEFKNWDKQLLHDPVKDDVFSLYERHGYRYLKKLDLSDAHALWSKRLKFRYPENVKVYNSKVYYIYRPFGSNQKRFLYSEELY